MKNVLAYPTIQRAIYDLTKTEGCTSQDLQQFLDYLEQLQNWMQKPQPKEDLLLESNMWEEVWNALTTSLNALDLEINTDTTVYEDYTTYIRHKSMNPKIYQEETIWRLSTHDLTSAFLSLNHRYPTEEELSDLVSKAKTSFDIPDHSEYLIQFIEDTKTY